MGKPNALYILGSGNDAKCYSEEDRHTLSDLLTIESPALTPNQVKESPEVLNDVEIILSAWGGPKMDADFLTHTPRLKAVFYAAGSIRNIVTDAFWDRDITICSAWAANGVPVAEYTLSQILWALKLGHLFSRGIRERRTWGKWLPVPGAYNSTVGLISLGMIGRLVAKLLTHFDVNVVAYDPFATPESAAELGVELLELDEVFRRSAVVSLHTPNLPETRRMIRGRHLELMPENSTLINTARGAVIDEPEMIAVLEKRQDLQAVLDVTSPEPPEGGSPLYSLCNVTLTPHIAGSMDMECHRMGNFMLQEVQRYLTGKELKWQVTREKAQIMA